MTRILVNFKIDLKKIDQSRCFKGEKGTYCDLTVFIDPDNPSQYGSHGLLSQSKKKDEPKDLKLPIVGDAKVFWQEQGQAPQAQQPTQAKITPAPSFDTDDLEDDIPF